MLNDFIKLCVFITEWTFESTKKRRSKMEAKTVLCCSKLFILKWFCCSAFTKEINLQIKNKLKVLWTEINKKKNRWKIIFYYLMVNRFLWIKFSSCIVDEIKVCGLQIFNYYPEITKTLIFYHKLSHIVIKAQ